MRAVRLTDSALDDIDRQLSAERAAEFKRVDLRPVLDALSEQWATWDEVSVAHGPARRLTVHGRSVAGFHLFAVDDTEDPRDGAIVIYLIDIWADELP